MASPSCCRRAGSVYRSKRCRIWKYGQKHRGPSTDSSTTIPPRSILTSPPAYLDNSFKGHTGVDRRLPAKTSTFTVLCGSLAISERSRICGDLSRRPTVSFPSTMLPNVEDGWPGSAAEATKGDGQDKDVLVKVTVISNTNDRARRSPNEGYKVGLSRRPRSPVAALRLITRRSAFSSPVIWATTSDTSPIQPAMILADRLSPCRYSSAPSPAACVLSLATPRHGRESAPPDIPRPGDWPSQATGCSTASNPRRINPRRPRLGAARAAHSLDGPPSRPGNPRRGEPLRWSTPKSAAGKFPCPASGS